MSETIGIRFRESGKIYDFDPQGISFAAGDKVIVETQNGAELVEVAVANREASDDGKTVKPIIRPATKNDVASAEFFKGREAEAFEQCRAKITELGLEMKLTEAHYSFDGSRIVFYFTADGRVDFRQLLKELTQIFRRTRIELRQISTRDQCKMLGGLGVCGRPYCCKSFPGDFQPVTIKMAKEQGFSLNPTKISGACGRLMCCLKYEQEAYSELLKITPKKGDKVRTPAGNGTVIDVNLVSGLMKVTLDDQPDSAPLVTNRDEVTPLGKSRTDKIQTQNEKTQKGEKE